MTTLLNILGWMAIVVFMGLLAVTLLLGLFMAILILWGWIRELL